MVFLYKKLIQNNGRVAQWIRVLDSESRGRGFKSLHAHLSDFVYTHTLRYKQFKKHNKYGGLIMLKKFIYAILLIISLISSEIDSSYAVDNLEVTTNQTSVTNITTNKEIELSSRSTISKPDQSQKFSFFGKRKALKAMKEQRTQDFVNLLNELSTDSDVPKSSEIEISPAYEFEKPLETKINRKNLGERENITTGKANRIRAKELGLYRGTVRYSNPRALENPNIYGPYLSAMLKDENLQERIMIREEDICEAIEQATIEHNILKSNPWFGKAKTEKIKILERKKEELKLYGRYLKVGENPDATLEEKVIDIEARRRLELEDLEEELDQIDWDSEIDVDTLFREKVRLHPFVFKYLSPLYEDEELERSPEDFISATDVNMTYRRDDYDITDEINTEIPKFQRYKNFSLDNLLHYGPSYGEIVNSLYIIALMRFCIMSIKYDPKSGFIIAIIGLASAFSYMKLFRGILDTGYDTFPGIPNLYRLSPDVHLSREWIDYLREKAKVDIVLEEMGLRENTDPYLFARESKIYYIIKKILFWFRYQVFDTPSVQDFFQNCNENITPKFLTPENIIKSFMTVFLYVQGVLAYVTSKIPKMILQNIIDSLYVTQFLRSTRRYLPYPLYWHLGITFTIAGQFVGKWKSCVFKLDQFIQLKLVPEMRYEDIITAEYLRSYLLMTAVYLVLLAMLHAVFNQFYYLPFISEMVDTMFGKRTDFKPTKFLRENPQFGGGDLSWQNQWEFMESSRGDFKLWYGLLGKPRKYKLPKWAKIFNPIWWLKKIKRKRSSK